MVKSQFFEAPEQQSIIKTKIVAKYFGGWSRIMLSQSRQPNSKIAYIDLFCGPGRFEDGRPSTPLWLLNHAIKNDDLCKRLTTSFNDKNPEYAKQLQQAISELPGIERLKHPPQVSDTDVGDEVVEMIKGVNLVPTLFFIDPWGYKGLSLELIKHAIRSWGCECIFFFNYNRINAALTNPSVEPLITDIFGPVQFNELRESVKGLSPDSRQKMVIGALVDAIKGVGGDYVLPFEFESRRVERTSHYIIFVSKSKRGYLLMKDVMFGLSSDDGEVKSFGYKPARLTQLGLLPENDDRPYSIPALKQLLLSLCSGKSLSVKEVAEDYTIDTPYVKKHVKEALKQLETKGLVNVSVAADHRKKINGVPTLADHLIVTFPG